MTETPPLVDTQWLAAHLTAPDVRIVDASWYLPQQGRDARADYRAAHIPGAVFFDLDDISDSQSPYPHMLPGPEKFSSRVRALGLGDGHHIVVYDGMGLFSAPRAWWMFRAMGHEDVSVLDGGFPKWQAEHRPVEDITPIVHPRHFTARLNAVLRRDRAAMLDAVATGREQIVDARPKDRFSGVAPEPRPGLRRGHIPGSLNLPFTELLGPDGTLRPPAELKRLFTDAGLDLSAPIVTSCGSGVTAAILSLALTCLGHRANALYDGSWAEWGAESDVLGGLPVEV